MASLSRPALLIFLAAVVVVLTIAGCGQPSAASPTAQVSVASPTPPASTPSSTAVSTPAAPPTSTGSLSTPTSTPATGPATIVPSSPRATVPALPTPTEGPQSPALQAAIARVIAEGYMPLNTQTYNEQVSLRVIIGVANGSKDGYARLAFFFWKDKFIGVDTPTTSAIVVVAWGTEDTTALSYALYKPADEICCPSGGNALVRFHYDGSRLLSLDTVPPDAPNASFSRR